MSKDPKALLSGLFRKQKRQVAAANAMVESAPDEALRQAAQDDFTRESVKLKAAEKELKDFCKQTGFQPDTSRVWVNGFGRSVSQRAVHANKNILQFLDQSDIINIGTIMKGYEKYIQKYPDSGFNYYMINYKLQQAGLKKIGIAVPAKPKKALLISDPSPKCKEPNHIFDRMNERNITEADLQSFMQEAAVMFVQWNGQRQTFRTDKGAVVITKHGEEWIYKTAWSTKQFNEEEMRILEVIRRYAGK